MIEVNQTTVVRNGRRLIHAVTLGLAPGEVVAVVGPNGAGKTTLLRVMTGEWRPSEGMVRFDSAPLASYDTTALARRRAVMAQKSWLTFDFSVQEVVQLGRTPHKTTRLHDLKVVQDVMAVVGIKQLAARRYPTLSGGEQQRVHLARALAQIWDAPGEGLSSYLFLDEPTSNLDLAHQHHVLKITRQCAKEGVGVLAVLHDLNLAAQYADRIAVMQNGQLIALGTPSEVLTADVLQQAFGIPVHITTHPCHACPLVVPIPTDLQVVQSYG